MSEVKSNLPSPNWQTYVTTIECKMIDEYVSIMVKNDWSCKCTWYKEYKELTPEIKKGIKRDRKIKKKIELCQGPLCSYVISHRDKLIKEEETISTTG